MKKISLFLLLALLLGGGALPVRAQVTDEVTKFAVLETLIDVHKRQSDMLSSRIGIKVATTAQTELQKISTEDFRRNVKKLSNRMCDVMSYVSFAAEVAQLEQLVEKVTRMEGRALDLSVDCSAVDPGFLTTGIALGEEFSAMISGIVAKTAYLVAGGLQVTMATQEQRQSYTRSIRADLLAMRDRLAAYCTYASAVRLLGRTPVLLDDETRFGTRRVVDGIWTDTYRSAVRRIETQMKDSYKL